MYKMIILNLQEVWLSKLRDILEWSILLLCRKFPESLYATVEHR